MDALWRAREIAGRLDPLDWWIIGFLVVGLVVAIFSGYVADQAVHLGHLP